MRSRSVRTLLVCAAIAAAAAGVPTFMTPSLALTNDGSITLLESPLSENFDALISTGSAGWVNNSTIKGWYTARTGTGTTIVADTGSSNGGNLYSYGSTGSSDRALGSIGSSNAAAGRFFWGVRLVNNTGATMTSLTVSYVGEQWRNGGATSPNLSVAQTVDFQYQVASAGAITGVNSPTTGWVDHDPLDFTSPTFGTTA